ncbi:MAG: HEAT repeat domain-containing protein [Clostridiaceae bacterium]|jgi:HEAT repeat protein|nr:HEAT repeat domain-containing protein [Clostridiaceae bacterium]
MGLFGPNIPKLMDKKDIGGLVKALKHPKFMIRAHAAYALGEIGAPETAEPLIQAMYDNRLEVRYEAARSLGMLKSALAVDALIENLGYGYYVNPDLWVVTDVNENVVNLNIGDTYNKFRDNVKWALIEIGEPSVGPMMRELRNRSPYIRASAAQVLGCLKSKAALDAIRPLLNDSRSFVREAASWAVGNIS